MKKIMTLCKFTFAVMACALPLTINANPPMASDDMMRVTNSSSGKMMSDSMNAPKPAQMDNMATDKMHPMSSPPMGMTSDNTMNAAHPPHVGDMASDFMLKTLDGQSVQLNDLTAKGDVALVELRGWPGYQCPACTAQAHDFVSNAEKLRAAGVQVVMIYPGPADDLKAHATEFLQDKNWPKDFLLVLDPDYSVTKSYGLRWDAPKETAYPSTFLINKEGKVTFAHVSKQHGDRVGSDAVLKAIKSSMSKPMM